MKRRSEQRRTDRKVWSTRPHRWSPCPRPERCCPELAYQRAWPWMSADSVYYVPRHRIQRLCSQLAALQSGQEMAVVVAEVVVVVAAAVEVEEAMKTLVCRVGIIIESKFNISNKLYCTIKINTILYVVERESLGLGDNEKKIRHNELWQYYRYQLIFRQYHTWNN